MRIILNSLALILLFTTPSISEAQIAGPSSRVYWEIDAPSLADAQAWTYKYYLNNSATATGTFQNVPCAPFQNQTTVFTCNANIPQLSTGTHVIQITATNSGGESPRSTAFTFQFQNIPNAPRTLRLTPTPTSSLTAPTRTTPQVEKPKQKK